MSYRIITDSCCDFPAHMYDELNLTMVPLFVRFQEQEVCSYTEQWLKEMFDGLRAGQVATTSAVNPQAWQAAIEPVLQAGEDALVLAFSSGLSTTYQSAEIAAQDLAEKYPERTVKVVDTRSASLGRVCWCTMPAKSGTKVWICRRFMTGARNGSSSCATGLPWTI